MDETVDLAPLLPKDPLPDGEHHLYTDGTTGIQLFATVIASKISGWRATDAAGHGQLTTFRRIPPSSCLVCVLPVGASCSRTGPYDPCGAEGWGYNKPSRCFRCPCYLCAD